ncbi:hypothetical protein HY387_01230 [Candidatus Daviesbacteria bacterium]|nr:hypothetical protein [Candidatus Daviesbacteria bacterium]
MGKVFNLLLRASIFYFLLEVMLFPEDPRFAGKAIPIRNLIIVTSLSLLFPILYFLKKKWKSYPYWLDNLYLSLFWLDMAGNSFNLYDSFRFFDLIPHFHGTGAIAAVFYGAFSLPFLSALGLANIIHLLLEAQEYYTDVFFGTHNVGGIADTINDLMVGVLGTAVYLWFYRLLKRR